MGVGISFPNSGHKNVFKRAEAFLSAAHLNRIIYSNIIYETLIYGEALII